jgi:excisionase family DNA binding protein
MSKTLTNSFGIGGANDSWLTVEDAAGRLKVDKQFIYEACASKSLRCARLGRIIRIRAGWLDEWVEQGSA